MAYKNRPGIVLIRVCDTDILVAKRESWEECRRVRPVPRLWAVCWSLMEQGKTTDEVVSLFTKTLGMPEEKVLPKLDRIFESLYQEGYLLPCQGNGKE